MTMQNHNSSKVQLDPVSMAMRTLADIVEMIDKRETSADELQEMKADATAAYNALIGRETTATEKAAISSLQYSAKELEGRDSLGDLDAIGYLNEAHEVLTGRNVITKPAAQVTTTIDRPDLRTH